MTAVDAMPICPSCKATNSVDLEPPIRLCLECRAEWNPAEVVPTLDELVDAELGPDEATTPLPGFPGGDPVPAEVVQAAREAWDARPGPDGTVTPPSDWSGFFVRDTLHPERGTLLVTVDDGGEGLELSDSNGRSYVAGRSTMDFLGDEPIGPGELVAGQEGAELIPLAPIIFAVAGLALEAGVDAVAEDGERELYNPRIGWLPPPCDGVPEVEQGIAYAVAILIRHFDLDSALIRQLASGLLIGAEAGTESETDQ